MGLADEVMAGARPEFERMVIEYAARLASSDDYTRRLDRKATARLEDERRRPLEVYRFGELAEMSRDIFDDRHGFAGARHAFVTKRKPSATPGHLRGHTPVGASPIDGRELDAGVAI